MTHERRLPHGRLRVTPPPATRRHARELLRRRLGPLHSADLALYLAVNQLPHPPLFTRLMVALTASMNRGDAWLLALMVASARDRRRIRPVLAAVAPPLWLTSATVELGVKRVFRRRRPFVSLLRAVVHGGRPRSWSFPSGHTASAFAGAWLAGQLYPRWALAHYALATLVGFSRVYLGKHYPGDVLIGALTGLALVQWYDALFDRRGRP